MRRPRLTRRPPRTRTVPAELWYPDGPAVRERAVTSCPGHLRDAVADLDGPVPGTVTLRHDRWGWETGFHPAGGALVPAAIPRGGLFVTHVVAPQNLRATDADDAVSAWLVVGDDVGPRDRARLEQAGWRLGRPR